ncbi:MAG: glycosyl transferase, partial [Bacteroidales bacterium]|nr:glycosyl transferase [Bacteroidales bacterium]
MYPVIVFAYNRPLTTEKLLASLIRCKECAESDLYVFIDGPRNANDNEKTQQVREKFEEVEAFKTLHLN